MTPRSQSAASTGCPSLEVLRQFDAGLLSAAESEVIARHLLSCDACEATLDELDRRSDTLTRALERWPIRPDDEAELHRVQLELLAHPEDLEGIPVPSDDEERPGGVGTEDSSPRIPSNLGMYELIEILGQGATSSVYRARHLRLDREVAVKVFTSSIDDNSTVERFRAEMQAVGRLDHPNIIRATDAGEASGFSFLVMEYVDGIDLSTLLQRTGPLPYVDACEICRQAAMGLQCAHDHGMVHRDVKPSNLLLTSSGVVKLLDLGLVSFRGRDRVRMSPWDNSPRGTADYMAPEQWTAFADVDIRADVYSLGCTLYKLIVGRAPFRRRGEEFRSRMQAHLQAPIPSLREANGSVPQELDLILRKMMAKERADRFACPADVAEVLGVFARECDMEKLLRSARIEPRLSREGPLAPPRPVATLLRNRRFVLAAGAALAVPLAWNIWNLLPEANSRGTHRWRPLAPRSPLVLWQSYPDARQDVDYDESTGRLSIDGRKGLLLVNLGQPTSRAFTVEARLVVPPGGGGTGFFLDYFARQVKGGLRHAWQAISIERILQQPDVAAGIALVWQDMASSQGSEPSQTLRTPRAETRLPDNDSGGGHVIRVVLKPTGFPEVSWDGEVLPQSSWAFSWDRRSTEAETLGGEMRGLRAGRLGVFAEGCQVDWSEMRLRY